MISWLDQKPFPLTVRLAALLGKFQHEYSSALTERYLELFFHRAAWILFSSGEHAALAPGWKRRKKTAACFNKPACQTGQFPHSELLEAPQLPK